MSTLSTRATTNCILHRPHQQWLVATDKGVSPRTGQVSARAAVPFASVSSQESTYHVAKSTHTQGVPDASALFSRHLTRAIFRYVQIAGQAEVLWAGRRRCLRDAQHPVLHPHLHVRLVPGCTSAERCAQTSTKITAHSAQVRGAMHRKGLTKLTIPAAVGPPRLRDRGLISRMVLM